MILLVSRDSVAAGDDVESHDIEMVFDARRALTAVVDEVVKGLYLPRVGSGSVWVVRDRRNGKALALVAEERGWWTQAESLVPAEAGSVGGKLHFQHLTPREAAEKLPGIRRE